MDYIDCGQTCFRYYFSIMYAHIGNIGSIFPVISYFLPCVPNSLIIDVIASYFRTVLKITISNVF